MSTTTMPSAALQDLLAGCDDTVGRIWSLSAKGEEPPPPRLLSEHDDWIYSCALSRGGDIAVTGDDASLRIWRVPESGNARCVSTIPLNTGVFGCAIHGDSALSASLDIKAWSMERAEAESAASESRGFHDGDVLFVDDVFPVGRDSWLRCILRSWY